MNIIFEDRMGNQTKLFCYNQETIESVLLRNHIPINSVLVTCDDLPVSENLIPIEDKKYVVRLIEGYDIKTINDKLYPYFYKIGTYIKNRVIFDIDGALLAEHASLELDEIVTLVEETIYDTIMTYKLLNSKDKILVGLSGGVDSSALLIALHNISQRIGFQIIAATFEDFDHGENSPTMINSKILTQKLGIKHELVSASIVEKTFNLNEPLKKIFPNMMHTKYKDLVMYADHHTTRRALEIFSQKVKATKIVLGLHTTDLIAGLLNAWTTGYYIADMFERKIGDFTYIYPLMFIPKKELHLYFYAKMNRYAIHSSPNAWEITPTDRNYYYYLADQIQSFFPGIENYLFSAHNWRLRRDKSLIFSVCKNCGSHILQQTFTSVNDEYCDVCKALIDLGYVNNKTTEDNHD